MPTHIRDTDPKVVVIGVGNSYRSDDGAGVFVGKELQNLGLPEASVVTEERDGLKIMDHWSAGDHVVIIDAVASGAEEGTVLRVDLMQLPQPASAIQSTHSFDITGAVSLARVVGKVPATVILYGIEGKNFAMGTSLSPKVFDAARRTLEMVLVEINALSGSLREDRLEELA